MTLAVSVWWLLLYWTYTTAWPRPFDDWKNTLFYIGAGGFSVFSLWKKRSEPLCISPPLIVVVFYLFICAVSINTPYYEGLLALARLLLWTGLVFFLTQLSETVLVMLTRCTVVSAAAIAFTSTLDAHGVNLWPTFRPLLPPIGHVSYYGDFMGLHVPLALLLFVRSPSRAGKTLWGGCFALILLGLWAAGARASIVGVSGALFFGGIMLVRFRLIQLKRIIAVCLFILATAAITNFAQPTFNRGISTWQRLAEMLPRSSSSRALEQLTGGRWFTYPITADLIAARPVRGWGIGSFRFIYPEFIRGREVSHELGGREWFMHPHNEILHQWAEVGIGGLAVFIIFWVRIFYAGIMRLKCCGATGRWTIVVCLMGIIVALTSWQLSTNFLFPLSRLLVALYVALLWKEVESRAIAHVGRVPMIVLLLLSTIFVGAYQVSLFCEERARHAGNAEEKLTWTTRSYQLAPLAFDPLLLAAASNVTAASQLHEQYPFVPMALYQNALVDLRRGAVDEAKDDLQHALRNAPDFTEAKNLLKDMTAHMQ